MYTLLCEHETIESVHFIPGGQIAVIHDSSVEGEPTTRTARVFMLSTRGWREVQCGHSVGGSENLGTTEAIAYESPYKEASFQNAAEGIIELDSDSFVSRLTLTDENSRPSVIEWIAPTGTEKPKKKAAASKVGYETICVHNGCADVSTDDSFDAADLPPIWEFEGRQVGISESEVILLD